MAGEAQSGGETADAREADTMAPATISCGSEELAVDCTGEATPEKRSEWTHAWRKWWQRGAKKRYVGRKGAEEAVPIATAYPC